MARIPKPWFDKERSQWRVTISGKRHNLGKDKTGAMKEFHRLMSEPVQIRSASRKSLPGIIDAFLEWNSKHRSPDTYEWYRYRLQRFVDFHPGLSTEALKPYHVENWVDSYPSLSRTSRRNYFRSIKRCLSWAKKQGYIDSNPLDALEIPSGDRKEVLVRDDEFKRMLLFVPDKPFKDLLLVTRETGCRPQESLRVEARHVDVKNSRWVFPKSESKGERAPRVVYLTPKALAITTHWMNENPTGPIFRNKNGNPWTTEAVNCCVDRIQVRMGKAKMKELGISVPEEEIQALSKTLSPTRTTKGKVIKKTQAELRAEAKRKLTQRLAKTLQPRYSLYSLRHSFATISLERGLDAITVANLLGHSDITMLNSVYSHLSQNPKWLVEQAIRVSAE